MKTIKVDVGEMAVSVTPGDILRAPSLGSSVAVVIFDPASGAAGLAHIALPDSSADVKRAAEEPGLFADTGLPLLLDEIKTAGYVGAGKLKVKIIGGAGLMKGDQLFNLGESVITAVREALYLREIEITSEDVGGSVNRVVMVSVGNGKTIVSSPGRGEWEI